MANILLRVPGGGGGQCWGNLCKLGLPSDGSLSGGACTLYVYTTVTDAIDCLNTVLGALAPSPPLDLLGVTGPPRYSGRLALSGAFAYELGVPADGFTICPYILPNSAFPIDITTNNADRFDQADLGLFSVTVSGVVIGSFDMGSVFNEAERGGAQTYPPQWNASGNVRITSVQWYNSFPNYQIGRATMRVASSELIPGYNYVYGTHMGDTSNTYKLWWDIDIGPNPLIDGGIGWVEVSKVVKHLSGIRYYTLGSTFDLACSGLNCFNMVYHSTAPLYFLSYTGIPNTGIDWNNADVHGPQTPPRPGDDMIVSGHTLTISVSNVRSQNARMTGRAQDPYGTYDTTQSASINAHVDTYGLTSTDLNEYFDDEHRRMLLGNYIANPPPSYPSQVIGTWNSSQCLVNGNNQVYDGQLCYPTINFTSHYPSQQPCSNYSAFVGDQAYIRAMYDSGDPHTQGTLEIIGPSDVDPVGTGNFNVEIKYPGPYMGWPITLPNPRSGSGWLDLGTTFNGPIFTGIDGDGCRVSKVGNQYNWTAGGFSTDHTNWMILVRVTFRNATETCTQIREVAW